MAAVAAELDVLYPSVGSVGIGYLIFQIPGCDIGIQPDVDFRRLASVHDAIGFGYGQSFFETPLAQAHRIGLAAALGEDYRRLTAQSVVAVHLDAYFAVARTRCREQAHPLRRIVGEAGGERTVGIDLHRAGRSVSRHLDDSVGCGEFVDIDHLIGNIPAGGYNSSRQNRPKTN